METKTSKNTEKQEVMNAKKIELQEKRLYLQALKSAAAAATKEYKSINAVCRALKDSYLNTMQEQERRAVLFALGKDIETCKMADPKALQSIGNQEFINLYKEWSKYRFEDGRVARRKNLIPSDLGGLITFVEDTRASVHNVFYLPALHKRARLQSVVIQANTYYEYDKKAGFTIVTESEAKRRLQLADQALAAAKKAAAKQARIDEEDRAAGAALRLQKNTAK